MRSKVLLLAVAITILAVSLVGVQPAKASVDTISAFSGSCTWAVSTGAFSSTDARPRQIGMTVFLDSGLVIGFNWIGYVAPGGSSVYSGKVTYQDRQPDGTILNVDISAYYADVSGVGQTVGTQVSWPNGWDFGPYAAGWFTCVPEVGVPGPSAPSDSVQKVITCDVAVFDSPGGSPVGDNRIKAGQTWFVMPGYSKDAAGKAWTQIFVGGWSLGWIPTRCIQGAEFEEAAPVTRSAPVVSGVVQGTVSLTTRAR